MPVFVIVDSINKELGLFCFVVSWQDTVLYDVFASSLLNKLLLRPLRPKFMRVKVSASLFVNCVLFAWHLLQCFIFSLHVHACCSLPEYVKCSGSSFYTGLLVPHLPSTLQRRESDLKMAIMSKQRDNYDSADCMKLPITSKLDST